MEIVVIMIMLLVSFSLVLKLTCLPPAGRLAVAALCALFTALSWETAAGQSKTQIADWLQNPELMLDIAVLLTIDVALQIAFCILEAVKVSGEKMGRVANIIRLATLWIPGILIFPTLFALLVEVIFSFPGTDFSVLAWTLAAVVFILAALLPLLMRWAVPELDLRLELIFMVNALIALLGVVATVNGRTAVAGTNSVEWQALAGVAVLLLVGAVAGLLIFKRNNNKRISHFKTR